MADTSDPLKPMTDGDIMPPPATTEFQPAGTLSDEGVIFESAKSPGNSDAGGGASEGRVADVRQLVQENASKYTQQATDKARTFAEDGKARAGGLLDQLADMLNEAAGNVDDKLGGDYGQYARTAAERVTDLSDGLKAKSVDEIVDDARAFVRKSPAVAIGAAAALGFVAARLLTSGFDQRDAV